MRGAVRLLAACLCALLLVASGCGGKNQEASPGAAIGNKLPSGGALDAIKQRGELRIGLNAKLPPFSSWNEQNKDQFTGYVPEVGQRLTAIIFGNTVKTSFSPILTPQEALQQGKLDLIMIQWEPEDSEREQFYFGTPYFQDSTRLLVSKDSQIERLADLNTRKVGQAPRVPSDKKRISAYSSQHNITAPTFLDFGSYKDAVNALKQGKVSAVVGATTDLVQFVQKDSSLALLPERYDTTAYPVVLLKANSELAQAVDKALKQMADAGELERLSQKWGLNQ